MKTNRGIRYAVVFACMTLGMQVVRAQSPDIISLQGNGALTWTNSNTNLFYQIQWGSALTGTGVWQSSYSQMTDILSTNPAPTVAVPMFYRVTGCSNRTCFAAPVPQTRYWVDSPGDDGTFHKGVPWPNPRFSVGTGTSSNCVTDNLTGLMWLRNPDATLRGWWAAMNYCTNLNGTAGRGGYADWRLPNVRELLSLIDFRYEYPCLPNAAGTGQATTGNPFTGIQTGRSYWSGTGHVHDGNFVWGVEMGQAFEMYLNKFDGTGFYTWPVRGGQ